jgi:non-specific serine/threonine protein kinase
MHELTAEALKPERLLRATGAAIYNQGMALYNQGQVEVEEVTTQNAICEVRDFEVYEVFIEISESYLYLRCDCEMAAHGKICRHDVAAALAIFNYLRRSQPIPWTEQLSPHLYAGQKRSRPTSPRRYWLFFSLQNNPYGFNSIWKIFPYTIPYAAVPKDLRRLSWESDSDAIDGLLNAMPALAEQAKQVHTTLNPVGCINCNLESAILANLVIDRERAYTYHYASFPLEDYLTIIAGTHSPLYLGNFSDPAKKRLQILTQPAELSIDITRNEQGLNLRARLELPEHSINLDQPHEDNPIQIISQYPIWVLVDQYLFKIENEANSEILKTWITNPNVHIPAKDEDQFLDKYFLQMVEQVHVESDFIQWENVNAKPVPRLYLSEHKNKLLVQLRFGYGEFEVNYNSDLPEESVARQPGTWSLARIQRIPEKEESIHKLISSSSYRLKRAPKPMQPGSFTLRANAHLIDFLMLSVPRLLKDGFEIYGEERLKSVRVNRSRPTLSFNISTGIDWFDLQTVIQFGDQVVPLKILRRAMRSNERYIKLADGSIGEIPPQWVERYRHLFAVGQENEGGLRLAKQQINLLDQLLEQADQAQADEEFKNKRRLWRDFSGIRPIELPAGFIGEMRPYQKAGYNWLHFLHQFEFGGCLADDMGLGKTIQVLAFLQSLKEGCGENTPPDRASLVIVPRSLLVNWQREAARFVPGLQVLEYFNSDRTQDPNTFNNYDLVITTYGIMLRDVKFLRQYKFEVILLDESQAIKNPLSKTAKAARTLKAAHRLVLTGTPVENSTVELWSQFAFLNPGLLGNLDYFRNEFANPIEKKGDEKAAQSLRNLTFPFILRRTKTQVAPELPPRTERILYADMEPAQRKYYLRIRDQYRSMLMGVIGDGDGQGLNQMRMKVLEGLLRLRQIANHPRLTERQFRGDSGKFELLLETLATLKSEGHKALVFSQFVQMLSLVREAMDARRWPYSYLDGHTRDRQERVDRFQNDPNLPFFLISLKAGGLGLNLTAADYVIHIDPWWNPAVEMQATDRTHRIGQDKPVFVYKLITRDSVEEKILLLQERKRELVQQLITTEANFFKTLTEEDVGILFS